MATATNTQTTPTTPTNPPQTNPPAKAETKVEIKEVKSNIYPKTKEATGRLQWHSPKISNPTKGSKIWMKRVFSGTLIVAFDGVNYVDPSANNLPLEQNDLGDWCYVLTPEEEKKAEGLYFPKTPKHIVAPRIVSFD